MVSYKYFKYSNFFLRQKEMNDIMYINNIS